MMKMIAGGVGIALAASPMLAFAHDDANKNDNLRGPVIDKTAVSIVIANDGATLVRGAKVTDVNDGDITAETAVNGVTMTWDIDTDDSTDYVDASSDSFSRSDIDDGDYVSFSGDLSGSMRVAADTVRDWSQGDASPRTGFWSHIETWPIFSFFAHAKVGNK
jgi:hypothetical protein